MEQKSFAYKAALEQNIIKGGPAVIGNMDDGSDVIFPGAFKGVLANFLKNGFVAYGHEWDELPIAMPIVAREEGRMLYSEAVFHSTEKARDARTVAKERIDNGLTVGLSIGYSLAPDGAKMFDGGDSLLAWAKEQGVEMTMLDQAGIAAHQDWCRAIVQLDELYEWSIVSAAMNRQAMASGVKRLWTPPEFDAKGATGFYDLPLAARDTAWDSSAADRRVRAWADAGEAPNAKYRRAFLWYDQSAPDSFGSYKLGYADVVDGELRAMPRGLFACAGVMQGARGGVDIPETDKAAVKRILERWYAKMRKEFDDDSMMAPWSSEAMGHTLDLSAVQTTRDLERRLRDAGLSKQDAATFISHAKAILLRRDAESEPAADAGSTLAPPARNQPAMVKENQGEPEVPAPSPPPPAPPSEAPKPRLRFGAGGELYAYGKRALPA